MFSKKLKAENEELRLEYKKLLTRYTTLEIKLSKEEEMRKNLYRLCTFALKEINRPIRISDYDRLEIEEMVQQGRFHIVSTNDSFENYTEIKLVKEE